MSLPGLGLDEPEEVHTAETTQHELAKEHEWRFEVAVGKYTQVKVFSVVYSFTKYPLLTKYPSC